MGGLTALAQAIIGTMIPPRGPRQILRLHGRRHGCRYRRRPAAGRLHRGQPAGLALDLLRLRAARRRRPHPAPGHPEDPAHQAPRQDRLARLHPADLRRQPAADLGFLRRQPRLLRLGFLAVGRHGGRRRAAAGPAGAGGVQGGAAHHPAEDHLRPHHRSGHPRLRGRWRGHVRFHHLPGPVLPGGPRRHAHRSRPADPCP